MAACFFTRAVSWAIITSVLLAQSSCASMTATLQATINDTTQNETFPQFTEHDKNKQEQSDNLTCSRDAKQAISNGLTEPDQPSSIGGEFLIERIMPDVPSYVGSFLHLDQLPTSDWMSGVPPYQLISHMSIPGTHQSCALYGGDLVECQKMTIAEQLNAGIRYLDIRCRVLGDGFTIHHGPFYQNLVFGYGVLDPCIKFLKDHPTETVLMRIKQEYSEASDSEFVNIFEKYKKEKGFEGEFYKDRMFTENRIPQLSEVRGKIVILSNVAGLDGISPGLMDSQDEWDVPTLFHINAKWEKAVEHLVTANEAHRWGKNDYSSLAPTARAEALTRTV